MFPEDFKNLIKHFEELPSIGPKLAERLVLHLFKQDKEKIVNFAESLQKLATDVHFCSRCYHLAGKNGLCNICQDQSRNPALLCVTEDPLDVIAIEKTGAYNGLYHVLGGSLTVMSEEEVRRLRFKQLQRRLKEENIAEVIIATNPTTDGDTTALYLLRLLKNFSDRKMKVTRLARGIPTGGDIEYADEMTLTAALEGRKEMVK